MSVLARSFPRFDVRQTTFAIDIIEGLSATPKRIPSKYFYDEAGSHLFEQITGLAEYYPTRIELQILRDRSQAICSWFGQNAVLIEFGSGSTTKAQILLHAAPALAAYVPVDISAEYLNGEAQRLRRQFPNLNVLPVAADFTGPFDLPRDIGRLPRVGFFPGSTIGNFEPGEAAAFFHHAADILGPGATFIVGVDLVKDPAVLNAAYNDASGVTARFNLNMLVRANRELGANFDLGAFEHWAFYNPGRSRIEMHLKSRTHQQVKIAGRTFDFRAGETIHTENSYKYTPDTFAALVRRAGWVPQAVWTDRQGYFSVHALKLLNRDNPQI
ncbi:MAG TPA: L-histidine N(alpha)-methyltransferase [Xanthobacteraceae bacterium]|jgi:dimethylhistidine N-methyltransferase|nr:L-histidine N(alpha)-methyltransferase [Xanthobacteraceae bacterium]